MSFDDLSNPSSIRISLITKNNTSFPAVEDKDFLQKLIQNTNNIDSGTIIIPFTIASRAQLASDNPVQYVLEFKTLLCDVLYILLGIMPDNIPSYKCNRKNYPKKEKLSLETH